MQALVLCFLLLAALVAGLPTDMVDSSNANNNTGYAVAMPPLDENFIAVPAGKMEASKLSVLGEFPVDVVFLHVNASDATWLENYQKTLESVDGRSRPAVDASQLSRFETKDELMYSLRSVHTYMPWANHIYIVTAGDRPGWMRESTQGSKVSLVQHKDIFSCRKCLPTFNSFAISAAVVNIPNLTEHFVLMDHDQMFMAPVNREDLFDAAGRPLVATDAGNPMPKRPPVVQDSNNENNEASLSDFTGASLPWAAHNVDMLLDRRYNKEKRSFLLHQPTPLTKMLFERMREKYGDDVDRTMWRPFRSVQDVLPHYLAVWVGLYERMAVTRKHTPNAKEIYLTDDMPQNNDAMDEMVANPPQFFSLNDVSSARAAEDIATLKRTKLLPLVPDPSPEELDL